MGNVLFPVTKLTSKSVKALEMRLTFTKIKKNPNRPTLLPNPGLGDGKQTIAVLSVFSSFLNDRYSRNLVNRHTSDWFQTTSRGTPRFHIKSCNIFSVYTLLITQ